DGRLTDSQGRVVDFKNTVIIMTTNLGTRDIAKGVSMGFTAGGDLNTDYDRMKSKVHEELKQHFKPEFLNRGDDTVVVPQLSQDEIVKIVDLMIAKLETRLTEKEMTIELTHGAKELLAEKGYDPVLGARPLRRTIQRDIEDTLSEKILFGQVHVGDTIIVDAEGEGLLGKLTFSRRGSDGVVEEISDIVDLESMTQARAEEMTLPDKTPTPESDNADASANLSNGAASTDAVGPALSDDRRNIGTHLYVPGAQAGSETSRRPEGECPWAALWTGCCP